MARKLQAGRQQDERHADAVDAEEILDVELGDPVHAGDPVGRVGRAEAAGGRLRDVVVSTLAFERGLAAAA